MYILYSQIASDPSLLSFKKIVWNSYSYSQSYSLIKRIGDIKLVFIISRITNNDICRIYTAIELIWKTRTELQVDF